MHYEFNLVKSGICLLALFQPTLGVFPLPLLQPVPTFPLPLLQPVPTFPLPSHILTVVSPPLSEEGRGESRYEAQNSGNERDPDAGAHHRIMNHRSATAKKSSQATHAG
jgi:hypothetical protein